MKRLLYCSIIIMMFVPVCKIKAQGAVPVTATGHIYAEVISAFTAVETSQLSFGSFSPGPTGGDIILTPHGTISVLGSVARGSGLHTAASFYLTGESSSAFSITLPKAPATLTSVSDARTMVVKDWVSWPAAGPGSGTLQEGEQTVYIGATLQVGSIQDNPVGIYTGTYTITFDFN